MATASSRLARANRTSHAPRVMAKEKLRRVRANPKANPKDSKVPEVRTRVEPRKLVYPVLKARYQGLVQNLRNLHRRIGWHEGWEQTCDSSTSSFSL